MSSADDFDDPDEYLDEDDSPDAEEWQPYRGECDRCHGVPVNGPLGPIDCACALGLGADEGDCVCGPPDQAAA